MPAAWAGERIRTVRQLLDISQDDLARASGVSQSLISSIEAGTRKPSDDLLDAVAHATATPRSFFDVAALDLPPGTLRFRKLAGARATDTRRAETLLREGYRVAATLLAEARLPTPPLAPAESGELTPDDLEHMAGDTRAALGLDDESPVAHVTRRCERAGIAVAPLRLPGSDTDERETVGHFGASCWPSPGEPAVIGVFPGGGGDRQRFTMAHELGHLVLHSRRRSVSDPEAEANRFAGAFLVPRHRMVQLLDGSEPVNLRELAQVKARWGVSIQALIMRGSHLGLVDERRKTSLFKQLSARGWRKAEPVLVHREEPVLLWELLRRRYGPSPYAVAADALGLPALLLRGLAPEPSRVSQVFETRSAAQQSGRGSARWQGTEQVIHRRDGRITKRHTEAAVEPPSSD